VTDVEHMWKESGSEKWTCCHSSHRPVTQGLAQGKQAVRPFSHDTGAAAVFEVRAGNIVDGELYPKCCVTVRVCLRWLVAKNRSEHSTDYCMLM
jgi:hypothetical protein